MPNWQLTTLDQTGRIVTGRTPSSSLNDAFGTGIPFITPSDMDGRRIIDRTARALTPSGSAAISSCVVEAPAVLVSCIGSDMGKAVIADGPFATNQQINSVLPYPSCDRLFLYYNLYGRRAEIRHAANGAAQPLLNKSDFGRLKIALPSFGEQCAIGRILGALDDKIELNRRMNGTLEAMAGAIFKDWFVDFGPTRAKMEGRASYLTSELWALFPDRLDEDRKPYGWRNEPLDEMADFLNGLALQKFPPTGKDDLPVIKIAQLRTGDTSGAGLAAASIPSRYEVRDGDVLFSWSGSLTQVVWTGGKGALNQHLFKVTSNRFPKWLHYFWVDHYLPQFQSIAASKATTMGHIQRHHLSEAVTTIGDQKLMNAAHDVIAPLFDRMVANALESRTLAVTRDLLLPKLMSGQIRVRDAEASIADAA